MLWGGVLQFLLVLSLALAFAQGDDEVSSLLRRPMLSELNPNGDGAQLTSAIVSSVQQMQQHMASRRLTTTTTNSSVSEAVSKAQEVGASVRKAVKRMRGGSDKFYRDLITAVKILMCQNKVGKGGVENPMIRYVAATDSLAYKDDTGACIRIALTGASDETMRTEYTVNHKCEVKPNCYWSAINAMVDTDRAPVYATEQSTQPADGAMTYPDAEDKGKKWVQGLLAFVVPGIILAVLSLLTMIFFLMCRCCCNRCGGRSPKEGGYTCMQKFLPLLFFLLFSIGVIVVAGVSLLYQKTLTAAVSDTFDGTSGTLTNASAWIVSIRTPLEKIRDKVMISADSVSLQLANTDFIDEGITGLTGALGNFEQGSAGRTLPEGCTVVAGSPYCVACNVCTTISVQVGTAKKQIEDNAGAGIQALKDAKTTLNTKLVSIKDTVKSNVDEQVANTDTFIVTINDTRDSVDDYHTKYTAQKSAQQAGVLVLFALALLVVTLGLIGILFGLTPLKLLANIIHVAYVIGFIALILTFLVSSIFLAISVLLGDACEVTMIFTEDWTVPLGDTAKGVNACFQNESLIDVLDLSSSLEFARGGIKFPASINTDSLLNFTSLDTFADSIQKTDTNTFNINTTELNIMLDALNRYTKQNDGPCALNDGNYTQANILTPWVANDGLHTTEVGLTYIKERYKDFSTVCPSTGSANPYRCDTAGSCTFDVFIGEVYQKASTLVAVTVDSAKFVAELQKNMTTVTDYTSMFKKKTKDLNNKVNEIKDDLESSLIKYVGDFEKAMYCTFIMDGFFEIYNALCGDLMPALTMISLMLFLAGVFLLPVNVCLIIALKRLKARGNGSHVMDNELKFK